MYQFGGLLGRQDEITGPDLEGGMRVARGRVDGWPDWRGRHALLPEPRQLSAQPSCVPAADCHPVA